MKMSEKKIWEHKIDDEWIKYIITYEDYLIKWERDIIENPDNHFKAEDDRRFGIYQFHHQSIPQFQEKPLWDVLPEDLVKEINDYLSKLPKEHITNSARKILTVNYTYWIPTGEKIFSESSRESSTEYYFNGKEITGIFESFIDPFDRKREVRHFTTDEILNNSEGHPKEVVAYIKNHIENSSSKE